MAKEKFFCVAFTDPGSKEIKLKLDRFDEFVECHGPFTTDAALEKAMQNEVPVNSVDNESVVSFLVFEAKVRTLKRKPEKKSRKRVDY